MKRRTKMKKLISLLLAILMVVALCACGNSSTDTAKADTTVETAKPDSAAETEKNDAAKTDSTAAEPEKEEVKWPNGDVTIYVPASVGSPLDNGTRVIADWLAQYTGANFIVMNDETGAGASASEKVYAAKPDGQTLIATGAGQVVSYYNGTWEHNPADPDDFSMICASIQQKQPSGAVIVTQLDKPFDDWQGFVDYVNANPNTLTVGIVNGTPHEVRIKLLFDYFGIADKVRYVSCTNTDVNTGILGGSIDIACLTETVGPQYITEGKLKGLIYSNYERTYLRNDMTKCLDNMQMIADIVTDHPEKLCCAWDLYYGGPAGMSPELCQKINDACSAICDSPEFMERVRALGSTNDYVPLTSEQILASMQLAEQQIIGVFGERD